MFTLGEATALALRRFGKRPASGAAPRTSGSMPTWPMPPQPVRRDSMEAGSFEDGFFAAPAKGECDRMLRAARDALDAGRRLRRVARAEGRMLDGAERAVAALTAGAVRVFEELCALARVNRGRVYPSYDRLAAATALGRATVARSLHLLEAAGFLVRQRRFVRVDGEGPRYAQTSNAYRPILPGIRRFLPHWRTPAPIPDDAAQHIADQAEATTVMREQLSCHELALATVDGALGRVLASLGAAIDRHAQENQSRRESHNGPETLPRLIDKRRGCRF